MCLCVCVGMDCVPVCVGGGGVGGGGHALFMFLIANLVPRVPRFFCKLRCVYFAFQLITNHQFLLHRQPVAEFSFSN